MGNIQPGGEGKVKVQCKNCGHEWKLKPHEPGGIKSYAKCPKCNHPMATVWPTR